MKRALKEILGILPWQEQEKKHLKAIEFYIANNEIIKVQVGCGPNQLKGWLNTDIIKSFDDVVYLDITQTLPFPSNKIDYITSEHLIEHITFLDGKLFLKECLRVLKPNGKVRITTPDLSVLLGIYNNSSNV